MLDEILQANNSVKEIERKVFEHKGIIETQILEEIKI